MRQPFLLIRRFITQLEKILKITDADIQSLLGYNDSNLSPLEERFNSKVTVRGENIYLKGDSNEIAIIEKVFKEMVYVLNTTDRLDPSDVVTIIDLTTSGKEVIDEEEYENIILYSRKDVIRAKTPTQVKYFESIKKNDICFAIGPAGTGKTYLAVAFAVSALKKGLVQRIVLARPAVEAGESLGFLPGDFKEKIDPYLRPLFDALQDMLPSEQMKNYLENGIVEIVPLAFMRGRTLNNAYVILDEAQNSTALQMKMFLTRLGPNSKAIITGDITQVDLPAKNQSGLIQVQKILGKVDGVDFIYFNRDDVVRHKLVKDIIDAYDKFNKENGNS